MKNINILILLCLVFFLASCGSHKTKEYYFQIDNFEQGKVYVYESEKSGRKDYWLMESQPEKGILITKAHNSDFFLYNEFIEQYDDNGSRLIEYIDYWEEDGVEMGGIQYDVVQNGVMDWSLSGPINFVLTNEGEKIEKSREYKYETTIDVLGKELEAMVFEDIYKSSNSDQEYSSIRYYAKGIGLVRLEYGEESNMGPMNLVEIIDKETWLQISP